MFHELEDLTIKQEKAALLTCQSVADAAHAYRKIPDPPAKFMAQSAPNRVRIEAAPTEAVTPAEAFRHHGRSP